MPGEGPATVARLFGDNLRRVRRREDLSQEQLAKRASLHRTEVGLLEGGGRACRIDTLVRLAGALAIRSEELLEGIAWIPGPETRGTFTSTPRPVSQRKDPALSQEDESSEDVQED